MGWIFPLVYIIVYIGEVLELKGTLIQIFILIPFILNGISLTAGILLYFWLILQRRKHRGKRNKGGS